MWTFCTSVDGDFHGESSKRFAEPVDAAKAAGEWLAVCAGNGFFPQVEVRRVRPPDDDEDKS